MSTGLPSISEPFPVNVDETKQSSDFGKEEAAIDCGNEVVISSMKQDEVAPTASALNLTLPEDSWKLEQAATKAQAAFRGYLVSPLILIIRTPRLLMIVYLLIKLL